jgi:hypothetical protein
MSEEKRPIRRYRIILNWNVAKKDGVVWIGLIRCRIGTSRGSCEHDNEPSCSIKCWEILYWRLLKKDSVSWSK